MQPAFSTNAENGRVLRIGMIGLDTSHVPAFVRLMNAAADQSAEQTCVRVVVALPAGNPEFPLSRDRLAGFTAEVQAEGVRLVESVEELLEQVDGVMLQSVDGRQHLAQATPVFRAGKPLFIDKPLAATLQDVLAIAELGRRHQVPWFTASAMRFTPGYPELRENPQVGRILGCGTWGLCRAMPGHPDLFWYGVHGIDLLYSLMGTGCRSVTAVQTEYTEHVTGVWGDGRVGTFRGIREETGKGGWGAAVFGVDGILHVNHAYDYGPLVEQIGRFFLTRQSPVPVAEMLEVFQFMEAAERSKCSGGTPVLL